MYSIKSADLCYTR